MPRHELDQYETPPHYVAVLLAELRISGRVYDPCAGGGDIADVLASLPTVREVITNDIDPYMPTRYHFDARLQVPPEVNIDWVISNPPFSDEYEILTMATSIGANIAFLARLSFLEPTEERAAFLEVRPPDHIIVLPRYSFRLNDEGKRATDSMTCCWLVWMEDGVSRRTAIYGRGRAEVERIVRGL